MLQAFLQHSGFARLTLVAVLLLCAGQTLGVQHFHDDALESSCVVCAAAQHDDDLLAPEVLQAPLHAGLPSRVVEQQATPSSIEQPTPLARAPPTV